MDLCIYRWFCLDIFSNISLWIAGINSLRILGLNLRARRLLDLFLPALHLLRLIFGILQLLRYLDILLSILLKWDLVSVLVDRGSWRSALKLKIVLVAFG